VCPFFKQNSVEGFYVGKENPIPQAFNKSCGFYEDFDDGLSEIR
jgi:hypothetical protein